MLEESNSYFRNLSMWPTPQTLGLQGHQHRPAAPGATWRRRCRTRLHRALHLLSLPGQGSGLEAPGQVGTGLQGAHFAGNHGGKGFIRSPAPHPGNVTVHVANSGAARVTTSGPHGAGCVYFTCPACPGRGVRRVHCTCAQDVARTMCSAHAPCVLGGGEGAQRRQKLSGIFPNR